MSGVSRFAKMADYMVGVEVDAHAEEEYYCTYDELWTCEPLGAVHSCRRFPIKPSADKVSIQCIEYQSHEHYSYRHAALAPHHKREYE